MRYIEIVVMAIVVSTLTRIAIRKYKQHKEACSGNDGSAKAR